MIWPSDRTRRRGKAGININAGFLQTPTPRSRRASRGRLGSGMPSTGAANRRPAVRLARGTRPVRSAAGGSRRIVADRPAGPRASDPIPLCLTPIPPAAPDAFSTARPDHLHRFCTALFRRLRWEKDSSRRGRIPPSKSPRPAPLFEIAFAEGLLRARYQTETGPACMRDIRLAPDDFLEKVGSGTQAPRTKWE
jgi:hypothetical protein